MTITAAASSPGLGSQLLAYVVLAVAVFAVVVGVGSVFSRQWRRVGRRYLAIPAGGLLAVYAVGRAIAEFLTVNYSDPASYRQAWGGPSLAGVFAVHAGPGVAVLVASAVWLYRRRRPGRPGRPGREKVAALGSCG